MALLKPDLVLFRPNSDSRWHWGLRSPLDGTQMIRSCGPGWFGLRT